MASEPNIDAAIYSTLIGDSTLSALVGSKVFYSQAPQGTAFPYVIFFVAGGGEENLTPRRSKNKLYFVKGVSNAKATASQIDRAVSDCLHGAALTVSGWGNYDLQRETDLAIPVENVQGTQVWHVGAYYRIKLAANTVG